MTKELYALSNNRSERAIFKFLDHFLPDRIPFADEFPVPEFSDSAVEEFTTVEDLISYLVEYPSEQYSVYWNDTDPSSVRQAMVFFTSDGNVIFGLGQKEAGAEELLELSRFVEAEFARFGDEQPPPETSEEFIAQCK